MGMIHNSETVNEIVIGAGIQTGSELPPKTLSNTVVPVMESNPKLLQDINLVKVGTSTNATTQTIYTVPTTGKTWYWGCHLSLIKDATATSVATSVTVVPWKQTTAIQVASIITLTLTAQTANIAVMLPRPILLEPASTIVVANGTANANISARACIFLHDSSLR